MRRRVDLKSITYVFRHIENDAAQVLVREELVHIKILPILSPVIVLSGHILNISQSIDEQ